MTRYIESQVYQAVVENVACEHGGEDGGNEGRIRERRRTDRRPELQLKYNKARQAAITQEACEIVSGGAAAAVSGKGH